MILAPGAIPASASALVAMTTNSLTESFAPPFSDNRGVIRRTNDNFGVRDDSDGCALLMRQ